jgi:hypothetical protein
MNDQFPAVVLLSMGVGSVSALDMPMNGRLAR